MYLPSCFKVTLPAGSVLHQLCRQAELLLNCVWERNTHRHTPAYKHTLTHTSPISITAIMPNNDAHVHTFTPQSYRKSYGQSNQREEENDGYNQICSSKSNNFSTILKFYHQKSDPMKHSMHLKINIPACKSREVF